MYIFSYCLGHPNTAPFTSWLSTSVPVSRPWEVDINVKKGGGCVIESRIEKILPGISEKITKVSTFFWAV